MAEYGLQAQVYIAGPSRTRGERRNAADRTDPMAGSVGKEQVGTEPDAGPDADYESQISSRMPSGYFYWDRPYVESP